MIKITVQRSLGSHIPDEVLRYSAELGVLSYQPQEVSLHSVVVYLDELVFVVPPNHPLASASQVSIQQLGAESFVAHIVSSPYREKVLQLFKTHKTHSTWIWSCRLCRPSSNSLPWETEWR